MKWSEPVPGFNSSISIEIIAPYGKYSIMWYDEPENSHYYIWLNLICLGKTSTLESAKNYIEKHVFDKFEKFKKFIEENNS